MAYGGDHNVLDAGKSEFIVTKMFENINPRVVSTSPQAIQKCPEVVPLVLYPVTICRHCVNIETSPFEVACSN